MQGNISEYESIAQQTEVNASFHETEIGLVPKDWKVVRLGNVAKTKSGGTPSRKKPEYFTGNIPWVKSGELDDNVIYDTEEKITEEALLNSSAKIFPKGTLLIAMYGATVGKTAILAIDASTNQVVCGIFPKTKSFLSEFVRYYLAFIRPKLLNERFGGAQPNISQTIVKNSKIVLPPPPEQQKIAKVLGTIQRTVDQQDKIIEATKNLKKSLMQKLFTQGIGHAEFKETEIGEIPQEWKVVRLGDVVDWKKKNINPLSHPDEAFEYYSIPAYHVNQKPVVEVGKNIRSQKFLVKDGTVLFAKLNPRVPKVWLVESTTEKRRIASTEFIPLFPKNDVANNMFLTYICWSDYVLPKSQKLVSGSTPSRQRVDINAFFKIQIPLPSFPEQQEIARILSIVDKKIEVEEKRKTSLKELFKTMLHKLMTAEIRLKDVEV